MKTPISIFWFRRDIRLYDNVGLSKALHDDFPVLPIFIFDTEILEGLPKNDARISFIYKTLQKIRIELQTFGSDVAIYCGKPEVIFKELIATLAIQCVYTNRDYEPYAQQRDLTIKELLLANNIGFRTYKDQVIFEKNEIVKKDGTPYVVFTPYMKRWKASFSKSIQLKASPVHSLYGNLLQFESSHEKTLIDIGFEPSSIEVPNFDITPTTIQNYHETRNIPALDGTSHLGPHLRFGTISIRTVIQKAIAEKNEVFWQELIWREFFMQILWHFPETIKNAFRKKYDRIVWRNNDIEFSAWKEGKTGYPLVDAGMRQLNATGYMHNRVRMIVASFLCKHLLIDWRWGEAYFAEKLLDYELASNIGNWQWAAGSGVDAAPYFRIFNPTTQIEKFDPDFEYIRKWVQEFDTKDYPTKIVDHKEARARALATYKTALSN